MNEVIIKLFENEKNLISKDALFNIIANLNYAQKLSPNISIQACRYSLRILSALIDEPDIIYKITDYADMPYMSISDVAAPLLAIDQFYGESNYEVLKKFLLAINDGMLPVEAALLFDIKITEYVLLENLLNLTSFWLENTLEKIREIRKGYFVYYRVGKYIKTYNPIKVLGFIKMSKIQKNEL